MFCPDKLLFNFYAHAKRGELTVNVVFQADVSAADAAALVITDVQVWDRGRPVMMLER